MATLHNIINIVPPIFSYVEIPTNVSLANIADNGGVGTINTSPMSSYLRNLVNGTTHPLDPSATLTFDVSLIFSCTANIIGTNGVVSYYISTDHSAGNPAAFISDSLIPTGSVTHYTTFAKVPVLISDILHASNTLFKINIVNNMTSDQHGGPLIFLGAATFVNISYLPVGYTL